MRLAAIAAERQSHEPPDADDHLHEVPTVEEAIEHGLLEHAQPPLLVCVPLMAVTV